MRGIRQPIPKMPTQIAGLDEILEGGLPRGRTTVVSGGPGSGKTVLGLEFLCRRAMAGPSRDEDGSGGVFVTFEERAEAIRANAAAMGWDLAALEKAGKIAIIEARLPGEEIVAGDFDIQGLLAIVAGHVKNIGARQIVMDALDVLLRICHDAKHERNELSRLHDWLTDQGMTSVLTVKAQHDANRESQYEFLDFMADCVIRLDHRVMGQVATRRLRVIKYRGSGFGTNEYPYVFGENGIVLFPLTTAELTHQPLGAKVSTGLAGLDVMLDGGFRRASCVLISGNSGTGKTTLASTFTEAACLRGERVLYLNFEESKEAMISGMRSPGIDLRPPLREKKLLIQTATPESTGSDNHLNRVMETIASFQPDHLILDAVSACVRMGSKQAAFDFMMRLVSGVKERGITSILTNQIASGIVNDDEELSGIGFSSVVDAVVQLRFVDTGEELIRQMLIVKSRGSAHSNRRQSYVITDRGIEFPEAPFPPPGRTSPPSNGAQKARQKAGGK
jgi:circadian clock protein KaiC